MLLYADEPEIGDMDVVVVVRGKDTGNAEDEFTRLKLDNKCTLSSCQVILTFSNLGAKRNILSGCPLDLFLRRH